MPIYAAEARHLKFEGSTFDVYRLGADEVSKLRFYWKDEQGEPYMTIGRLRLSLKAAGKKLLFATNGGIYSEKYTPLGLYVEEGEKLGSMNMGQGSGNFSMKPNAVFYVDGSGAHIEDSSKLTTAVGQMQNAVQSGPSLLLDGEMHPRFFKESDSYNIRNGVGIDSKGGVVFAISNTPVNFYTFAALFRDQLDCDNALYLDGSISEMYLPALERTFTFRFFTTILGVAE
ncbi:MAG: phosphodiester glycosidase family protein [Pseudomonadota bacterium]